MSEHRHIDYVKQNQERWMKRFPPFHVTQIHGVVIMHCAGFKHFDVSPVLDSQRDRAIGYLLGIGYSHALLPEKIAECANHDAGLIRAIAAELGPGNYNEETYARALEICAEGHTKDEAKNVNLPS